MDREVRCPVCGRILNGVTLLYGSSWKCRECADDKTDVLRCERGSKVKAVHLDNGWKSDVEQAHEFLKLGAVYEVDALYIGGYQSEIRLKEFPERTFNTVHFELCD